MYPLLHASVIQKYGAFTELLSTFSFYHLHYESLSKPCFKLSTRSVIVLFTYIVGMFSLEVHVWLKNFHLQLSNIIFDQECMQAWLKYSSEFLFVHHWFILTLHADHFCVYFVLLLRFLWDTINS